MLLKSFLKLFDSTFFVLDLSHCFTVACVPLCIIPHMAYILVILQLYDSNHNGKRRPMTQRSYYHCPTLLGCDR